MAQEYMFKSYQRLLEEALTDESKAGDMYRYMAGVSPDAGTAERLRGIAADEDRHHLILSQLLTELSGQGETGQAYIERIEYALGRMRPSQIVQHRAFPQTDREWEDLGYDIEAKLPGIGTEIYSVRDAVAIATGKREGDADEAKRWLVRKAGELGID